MCPEVSHDLFLTARLLGGVSQNFDPGIGLQDSSLSIVLI